jgi:serine/threonine protein kinase
MTLGDGWIVTDPIGWKIDPASGKIVHANDGSGGNFSAGYYAEKRKDGKLVAKAFLKGIDISRALGSRDIVAALKNIVDTPNFEKELLKLCGERKMDRVVLALASGDINLGPNVQDQVPYIIFELADGDVRRRMRLVSDNIKAAWTLRAVHHATVGLFQLHSAQVAHQDVKPSNVLDFESAAVFKLGDMGRALREGVPVPHDAFSIAGDPLATVSMSGEVPLSRPPCRSKIGSTR